jgi:ABC-type amino acid transport substrate-binding protein
LDDEIIAEPAPVEPTRRRRWPFIVGGAAVILAIGVTLLVLFLTGAGPFASSSPSTTVTDFDHAFATADCAEFQATTTADFQTAFFGSTLDCAAWEDNARQLRVDDVYAYTVEVHDTTLEGDTALVSTTEVDSSTGTDTTYELVYELVKTDGVWLIASITAAE